jgi:predicted transglutaminase-like cysteine proteinase
LGTSASALAAPKKNTAPAEKPDVVAQERQPASTARYFTINEMLARRDGQRANNASDNRSTQFAALDTSARATDAAARPPVAPLQDEEPFGLVTFRAPEGLLWVKWRKLNTELEAEARVLSQCRADPKHCANPTAQKYLDLIDESRNLPDHAKIDRINRAINAAVRYTSDQDQHGVPDLWTAPLATLSAGKGDCEDYAIAKYVALREAGFSTGDLRILLVNDRIAREHHAVVGVRQNGRWLMLDNRHEVLLEQKDVWNFTPLFALDQQGLKLFAAPYGKPPAAPPALAVAGPSKTIEPISTAERAAAGSNVPELRLNTFDPPTLRGQL